MTDAGFDAEPATASYEVHPDGEMAVTCVASVGVARSWRDATSQKFASTGVVRVVPPSETVRRVAPLMSRIGVTRVGEVTHLDRPRIPNFVAVRPREPGRGISYYNGKGATRTQARAGAMMEAIERFSGEQFDHPVRSCSYRELVRQARAIDPTSVLLPRVIACSDTTVIEWVLGFDLIQEQPTYVPLNYVVCPYFPRNGTAISHSSSHGLAAGNTRVEALCHALCEVNERDAMSLYYSAHQLRQAVTSLLQPGRGPRASDELAHPRINLESLPARVGWMVQRLRRSGLKVYLRDITSDTRIAAIECIIAEPCGSARHKAHGGYGSHPDSRVALTRAITEAAQSRLACIQGGREDLPEFAGSPCLIADPDLRFGSGPGRSFSEIPTRESESIDADVSWVLERFRSVGMDQVVAIDLTRPELGIPVVRVIVPHAEGWAAFRLHSSSALVGKRRTSPGDLSSRNPG